MCPSFPIFPKVLQAWGNNLLATTIIAGALVWHILHPPSVDTISSPSKTDGTLQRGLQNNPTS